MDIYNLKGLLKDLVGEMAERVRSHARLLTGAMPRERSNDAPFVAREISALGATTSFTVSDRAGRFELRTLSPGPYVLRAHLSGFVASTAQVVEVDLAREPYVASVARADMSIIGTWRDAIQVDQAGMVWGARNSHCGVR